MTSGQYDDYIKVSLYGQFDGEKRFEYRYPSNTTKDTGFNPKSMIFNPVKVLEQFHNARECYAVWNTPAGIFYGLVVRNVSEDGSPAMLLSIMVKKGVMLPGRQVVNCLGALRKSIIEDGNRGDEAAETAFKAAGIPDEPVIVPSLSETGDNTIQADSPKGTGYRTYASISELETILSFPLQDEYRLFRRVLIIPATTSLRNDSRLSRLTAPVVKRYLAVCPPGVTAAPCEVDEGQRLTLTFTKNGFTPNKETVSAGAPSPYLKYDGAVIRVKSPSESGMAFTRRIRINVRSSKGGVINGYTINVNGRPVNTMEPFLEFNEHDLTSGKTIQINVASNNFKPLKTEIDPSSLVGKNILDIELQPLEQGILLRLDFGEGRIFEQQISIEKNTPEYSQLHSGNFHGFRAYRLSSQSKDSGEVYNVDVRSANKPTAPTFTNVSSQADSQEISGRQIPVFENLTESGNREPQESSDNTGTEDQPSITDNDYPSEKHKERSSNRLGILIGVISSIVLLVCAIVFFLPGMNSDKTSHKESTTVSNEVQNTETNETASQPVTTANAPQPIDNNETTDISYLNNNDKWRVDDLKSDKYRALLSAFAEGDIKAIANHDYFAKDGNATNDTALKIVTLAWESLDSYGYKANVRVIKEQSSDGVINLKELYEQLMRRRPAIPNETPRPTR